MSRFRSTKRAKELNRKARHQAKETRKRERRERAQSGAGVDDIDRSHAGDLVPPGEESFDEEPGTSDQAQWRQAVTSLVPEGPADEGGDPGSGRES